MWLKNLQIYRLPAPWMYTAEQLAAAIAPQAFVAAASTELSRSGWYSPRENGQLVHTVNRQWLLRLRTEKKLLPASVVNQVAKARADELEEQQGFPPGKKAMKELKERAFDELLPRAFSQVADTWAWIDPVNGWLVVDAASSSRADDLLKFLLKAVDRMPVESLRVQRSPVAVMTGWLESDEAPHGFTIDHDAELRATGESRAAVRFVKHALEVDDVRRHIAAGKQATRLAMTWEGRISFVLTESLTIKSVKALDVLMEGQSTAGDDDRFDNDMVLMTAELAKLVADIVEALGGEAGDLVSERRTPRVVDVGDAPALRARLQAEKAGSAPLVEAQGEDDDGLYDQAVTVVRKNQRASISLVQRHLRIGYNRAARLLEQMESKHVVSAMQSNGNREVLPA